MTELEASRALVQKLKSSLHSAIQEIRVGYNLMDDTVERDEGDIEGGEQLISDLLMTLALTEEDLIRL